MKKHFRSPRAVGITLSAVLCLALPHLNAQGIKDQMPSEVPVQRAAGDSIQPVFDGWVQNPDGTVTMWFGYLNRNFQEQMDVPVGPANSFNQGGDRGQPTHFYTRRHQYVFKVDLPKGWTLDQKLIWSITAHGETSTATGWIQPEWQVDDGVRMMNAGAGLAPPEGNKAPEITSATPDQTTQVDKPLKLSASAKDDGIPKVRGPRGGTGIKWILYRGPGEVVFDPDATTPVYGKPVDSTTTVYFSKPGNYWLQAVASDGLLETVRDIKITVTH